MKNLQLLSQPTPDTAYISYAVNPHIVLHVNWTTGLWTTAFHTEAPAARERAGSDRGRDLINRLG